MTLEKSDIAIFFNPAIYIAHAESALLLLYTLNEY